MNPFPCEQCQLWDMAAKQSGYHSGMCEECFNEHFVAFNSQYDESTIELERLGDNG